MSRSQMMAQVRARNTTPERLIRSAVWRAGLRYRLHRKVQGLRPDLVFPGALLAVFIDGCFWHGCPVHYSSPQSSKSFWSRKLRANYERDVRQNRLLTESGWTVLRVWEHDAYRSLGEVVQRIERALCGAVDLGADWRVVSTHPFGPTGADLELRFLRSVSQPGVETHEVAKRKRPSRRSTI
jgi:DNA mismatch endonuclease (patch repair protein)